MSNPINPRLQHLIQPTAAPAPAAKSEATAAKAEPAGAAKPMLTTAEVNPGYQVHFRSVTDPAGTPVFQAFDWTGTDYSKTNAGYVSQVSTLNWPVSAADPPLAPGKYTLEVTSPGVERALRTPEHFQREIGKRVALRLSDASLDERRFDGLLVAADDSTATIRIGIDADGSPDDRVFSLASIDRAKTIFEWGPQPKPGGPRRKAGASGTHPRKPEPSVADGADHDTEEAP
jgi:hypothetical protein